MSAARATVIILAWNGREYLEACLDAVLAQDYANFGAMVVDNGSTDGSPELVADKYPEVKLLRNDRNLGFAAGNNAALEAVAGLPQETGIDFVVLLNQDTVVHPGWLASLATTFSDANIGIAGCKLLYPDGTVQHAGGYLYGPRGETGHIARHAGDENALGQGTDPSGKVTDVEFVTGAALAISRGALAKIGSLDKEFYPAYYEDVDWCFRARMAGYRVVYQPAAVVTHHESTTTDALSYERKQALNQGRLRFLFKHRTLDKLTNEFGPAELDWVASMDRCEELMAARRAYLNNLVGLRDILAFRGSSSDEADALVGLLTDLRAAAQGSLIRMGSPDIAAGGSATPEEDTLARQLHRLWEHQTIQEQPFTSQVPVLGWLIVAFRGLWNSVATKWYVRPMAHQQSVFNAQLVNYLQTMEQTMEQRLQRQALDIAENVRELTTLAEAMARAERIDSREDTSD